MPCPCFEPQRVAANRRNFGGRLPLLDEYDGLCHAVPNPFESPPDLRFRCCNHGNSRGTCALFPAGEPRSSIRFDVLKRTTGALELLYVEECSYAPLRWTAVRYSTASGDLEPDLADVCVRAQALAFCRSYLERFPD